MTRKTAFKPLGHEEMKSNKERGKSLSTENKLTGLLSELQDRGYREAYVEAHAKDTIAFQLRQMRLAENWEQKDVAAKLGNPKLQPMISRYENPDYGKYSVTTLLELAKVFDVALVVRFAKFSELLRWDLHKDSETLQPATFGRDVELANMGTETWMWRYEARTQIDAPISMTIPLTVTEPVTTVYTRDAQAEFTATGSTASFARAA